MKIYMYIDMICVCTSIHVKIKNVTIDDKTLLFFSRNKVTMYDYLRMSLLVAASFVTVLGLLMSSSDGSLILLSNKS